MYMKEKLSEIDKKKYKKVKALSKKGDLSGTLEVMEELVRSNPKLALLRASFANTLWDNGDLVKAEKEFRDAIALGPDLEKISLGLFHLLWEQGREDEAFEEMKRFMSISDSEDYRAISKEINEDTD